MDRQLGPRRTERGVWVGSSQPPPVFTWLTPHPSRGAHSSPGLQLPPLPLLSLPLGAWRKPVDAAVPRAPVLTSPSPQPVLRQWLQAGGRGGGQ